MQKKSLLWALALATGFLAGGCAKEQQVSPVAPSPKTGVGANVYEAEYSSGLRVGQSDKQYIYNSLTYSGSCLTLTGDGGLSGGPTEPDGSGVRTEPNDSQLQPTTGPGGTCRYWEDGNTGPDQYQSTISAMVDSGMQHRADADAAGNYAEAAYYRGYVDGLR
jgi:hypothetical protein